MTKHYLDTVAEFICATELADLSDKVREHGRWITQVRYADYCD